MPAEGLSKGATVASSNWFNLQRQLRGSKRASGNSEAVGDLHEGHRKKRRRLESQPHGSEKTEHPRLSITSELSVASTSKASTSAQSLTTHVEVAAASKNGESVAALQKMTLGQLDYTDTQKAPGKYLAIDCEMVGLGIDGVESSLARVSVVNFYGAALLDEFVKQKERVVDYRTQWSGIREKDMVHAKPFEEVQKKVADLIKDKILIGHAIHNDLKALLLSHPRTHIRDTQVYAHKFGLTKSKFVALRHLVKNEIGVVIQGGEHSSLTDARATMAIYRMHKKEWEKASRHIPSSLSAKEVTSRSTLASTATTSQKNGTEEAADIKSDDELESTSLSSNTKGKVLGKRKAKDSGGGRKGVSSGLSTIVHRKGEKQIHKSAHSREGQKKAKSEWWKQLPGSVIGSNGAKGSISVGAKR